MSEDLRALCEVDVDMWTLIVSLLLAQSVGHQPEGSVPLSLCALFSDPHKYDGLIVSVKAQYGSNDESSWIGDEQCASDLVIGEQKWPRKIHLWALQAKGMSKYPVDFEPDIDGLARLSRATMIAAGKGVGTMVVIQGQFQYYPLARGQFRGTARMLGFGHLNGFAAQLVVKRVLQITMIPPRQGSAAKKRDSGGE